MFAEFAIGWRTKTLKMLKKPEKSEQVDIVIKKTFNLNTLCV